MMSKKQKRKNIDAVYGGKNTKNPPFNIGDKIRQRYTVDSLGNLLQGSEEFEFMGMDGDLMKLKTLNYASAMRTDTLSDLVLKDLKKLQWKPVIGDIVQLHYESADRYEIIK